MIPIIEPWKSDSRWEIQKNHEKPQRNREPWSNQNYWGLTTNAIKFHPKKITKRSKGRTSNAALTQKLLEDDLLAEAKRVERGRKPLLALRPRKPFGRAGALEGGHGAGAKESIGFEAFKETMDGAEQVAMALSLHRTMDSWRRETPRIETGFAFK